MRSDFITSFRKHLNSDNRVNNCSKRLHLAKRFSAVCKDCERCSCYFSCRLLLPASGFHSTTETFELPWSHQFDKRITAGQKPWMKKSKRDCRLYLCGLCSPTTPVCSYFIKIVNQESTRDKRNRLNAQVCHFDLWLILSLKTIDELMEEEKKSKSAEQSAYQGKILVKTRNILCII